MYFPKPYNCIRLGQTWFFSFIPLNLRNKNKTYIILGPYYIQAPLQFDFSLLWHFFIPTLLYLVWKSSFNIFLLETAINLSDAFFLSTFLYSDTQYTSLLIFIHWQEFSFLVCSIIIISNIIIIVLIIFIIILLVLLSLLFLFLKTN